MCFSLEADLVVGAALLPVGVLSLRAVREPREVLLASLPLLFSAHQLVETLVWAGAEGHVGDTLAHVAAVVYVVIALPLLPTLVPLAVLLIEPRGRRLRITPFLALGAVVTSYLSWTLVDNGVAVSTRPRALVYEIGLDQPVLWTALYIAAVMGAAVLSGYRSIVVFGIANLVGLTIVGIAYQQAFASLWCVWAAVTSVLVLLHMRRRRSPAPPEVADALPAPGR